MTEEMKASEMVESQIGLAEQEWLEEWTRGPSRLRWDVLPVQVGDAAPNLSLLSQNGTRTSLGDFWNADPALILFWRHYGCGCGVERAERLLQEWETYEALSVNVVIVGQAEPERTAQYARARQLPCPLLCDPAREAYGAYGVLEGRPSQVVYSAGEQFLSCEFEAGASLVRERRAQGRPIVDSPWQLPAEFVVGVDGNVVLAYRYQYCSDYPDARVLAAALHEARRQGADAALGNLA